MTAPNSTQETNLYKTGIRPLVDDYLLNKKQDEYPDYWRASSAGFCLRYNIFKRLGVPAVPEIGEDLARKTRVFEAGHIFHHWLQGITQEGELSIASELEVKDDNLHLIGHFDDLIKIDDRLLLMDYKTAHSKAFDYSKPGIGFYHRYQLGTYLYMLRKQYPKLEEARILQISKDDLRMREFQLLWSPELESDVLSYWTDLNTAWDEYNKTGALVACTCLTRDDGWFGKRSKYGKVYNDAFYNGKPCSLEWFEKTREIWEKKDGR